MANYMTFNNVLVQAGVTLTHTPDSGTITDVTNINKILVRQLEDSYIFTPSASGSTLTIENIPTVANGNKIGMISIMNLPYPLISVQGVTIYAGVTSYTTTRISRVEDNTAWASSGLIQSYHFKVDDGNLQNIDKIELDLGLSTGGANGYIGHVYAGEYVELSVRPNVKYSSKNEVNAEKSNGGQFYYREPISLKTIKAHITHKTQSETSTLYQNSLNHGTSIPVVFISDSIDYQTMYCTFQSPLSVQTIPSTESGGGWYHSADINIIENR